MSQKRKIQAIIGEMYGWTKERTSKIQNNSNTRGKTHNSQLEQQLHEFFGSSSDNDLDEEISEVQQAWIITKGK